MCFRRTYVAGDFFQRSDEGDALDDIVNGGKVGILDVFAKPCAGVDDKDGHHIRYH